MKAAAVYARVSTEEQTKNTSLSGQCSECRELARAKGYTVIKEIAEDFTGSRLDRPGLGQIRDMVARREIEALLVYDPDRLSRNNAHTWVLLDEFEQRGVEVLFVNAPREDSLEGNVLFGVRVLFAEYEREKIKQRMRLGKERRAKSGSIVGTPCVPYGYEYVSAERTGHYEIL